MFLSGNGNSIEKWYRAMLRYVLQVLGVALFLSGGLWALQGLGIVM